MTEPVLTAVAVAVATKAVDGLSEAGKAAFAALRRLIRRKFGEDRSVELLSTKGELSEELRRAAAEDDVFAHELDRLWRAVEEARIDGPTILGGVHYHSGASMLAVPPPRQLPLAPAVFVGREEELAELDRVRPERGLVVLTGPAGVGKSALAIHWSTQVTALYPDGQLYASLGAHDPSGPVAPGEVLGGFLRALGVPRKELPVDVAQRAALFRSMTADRRILVILDNAVSAAQVRQVLPAGPGCLAVVTARARLGGLVGEGARFVAVAPLDRGTATRLLTELATDTRVATSPDATAELIDLCAGLPIALLVTAARLASHPQWTVRRVAAELLAEYDRLDDLEPEELSVRATFDVSYRSLSDPVARCYRVLGLHPGSTVGADVVAAALDLPLGHATSLLDTLVQANLVDDVSDDRFRMHDLLRRHAQRQAEVDPERRLLFRRIVTWYLANTGAADQLLRPYRRKAFDLPLATVPFDDRDTALAWLEQERANLVAAVVVAAEPEPELAWQLSSTMWSLFQYGRHHHDRMVVNQVAVACARRLGNRDYEARILRRSGICQLDVGETAAAARLLTESLALCRELGDRYGEASALDGLGKTAQADREFHLAIARFTEALVIYQATSDHLHVARTRFNLGVVANAAGEPTRALAWLAETDEHMDDLDPYNATRVSIERGRALAATGQFEAASGELTGALADMRRLGSPRGEAEARRALGDLALERGDSRTAVRHLRESHDLYERLGDFEAADVARSLALIPEAETDAHRVA